MAGGQLHFEATIEDKDFNNKLNGMKKGVEGLENQAVRMTEKQQKAYERLANTIKSNQESLKNATDPTQIALYNQRIKEATASMQKLVATASKPIPVPNNGRVMPYNYQGNSIGQMQDALGSFKDRLVGEKDINNIRQLNSNIQQLEGNIKRTTNIGKKGFDEMGNAIPTQKVSNFSRLFSNIFASFGIFAGISTAISLIKSFYDTTKQLQTLNKAMELGAKDSEAFRSNLSFLKDITEQYGLELISTSEAYNKFYIAAKNKLALDNIQLIFEKISKSASLMGLSVADQAGIFRALEQMMSKGTVQAEELRGQLGDRLPGAFEIMARSMRISTTELGKMMQNGEVIASEVLPKFAVELEKTFGADKVTMIDNLTASENRLKNEWTEFVEEINGSDNAIGNFVTSFLGGVSSMIAGITRLSSAWSRLWGKTNEQNFNEGYESAMVNYTDYDKFESQRKKALKDRQEFMREERELNKQISELTKEYEEKSNKSILGKAFTFGKSVNALGSEIEDLNKKLGDTRGRIKAIEDLEAELKNPVTETKVVEETEKQRKERERAEKEALKNAEDLGKKRIAFVLELQKAENNLSQSTLTGLDLELTKVEDVYQERLKKAKELKANQDAINRIEALRTRETEIVTFKAETEGIKAGLETLRKDYEDFENAKKQIGIQKATELYKEQLDISKTYQQALVDEINNLSGRDLNDLEKSRLAELMKLYADYNIQKAESDRKSLESLLSETQSFEDKLLKVKEDANEKRKTAELITNESLKNEKLEIIKQQEEEATAIIENEIYERNAIERQLIKDLTTYSNRELKIRIKSLKEFLEISGDTLSTSQKEAIEAELSLTESILGATTQISKQNALLEEKKRITKAIKDNTSKDPQVAKKLAKELTDVNGLLEQNDSTLKSTQDKIQFAVTTANQLADAFGGTNNELREAVSLVGDLVSQIGSGIESGNFTGAITSIVGYLIQGIGNIFSSDTDGDYQLQVQRLKAQEEYNKKLREQLLIETRINDAYQSRSQAILEEQEALNKNRDTIVNRMKEILTSLYDYFNKGFGDINVFDYGFKISWDELGLNEYFEEGVQLSDELLDKLEQIKVGGGLSNQADYLLDELIKLRDEFGSIDELMRQYEQELKDRLTGTTTQSLTDAMKEAVASGRTSFEDLANDIEGILRNAILAGLETTVFAKQVQELQDLLYNIMEDGITDEERKQFEDAYVKLVNDAKEYVDLINQAGIDLGGSADDFGSGAKDGIKRITEQQADRWVGVLIGSQEELIQSKQILFESKNLLSSSLDNLVKIEYNTARTYQALERIESGMQNNQNQALGL